MLSQNVAIQRTPVLDAVEVTGRIFEGPEMKDIPDRRLVIFSDMIESSERYEFTTIGLSRTAIPQIIEKEKKNKRLADLRGVRVWFAGAVADVGPGFAGELLRGIEDFWREYFRVARAELPQPQYGSALLNFSANP